MKERQKPKCEELQCPSDDTHHGEPGAVLLSQDIEYYAVKHKMIIPFNPENLKPAGIYLCLGDEYSLGGKPQRLYDSLGKNELTIPPFEVAIISTEETINLPRFLIARWNLRVTYVYKGLLWTGALQVDPGWCGQLYCPIYNLSSEPVTLKKGEPIVLMDFVKTTPFLENESKPYDRPPKRRKLEDYGTLTSALYTRASRRLDDSEKRIYRMESLTGLIFTGIAILFAALAILVTSGEAIKPETGSLHPFFIAWPCISIAISIFALFIALSKPECKKTWQKILLASFFIVFSFLFALLAIPLAERGILSLLGIF